VYTSPVPILLLPCILLCPELRRKSHLQLILLWASTVQHAKRKKIKPSLSLSLVTTYTQNVFIWYLLHRDVQEVLLLFFLSYLSHFPLHISSSSAKIQIKHHSFINTFYTMRAYDESLLPLPAWGQEMFLFFFTHFTSHLSCYTKFLS
jgi:hypothetical protein